jgi:hypothetical protein
VANGLIAGPTRWALFLAAHGEPEDRHIKDLIHGFYCLEMAGVDPTDISIYIDGSDRAAVTALMSLATSAAIQVKRADEFFVDVATETAENLVMFVTGHGSWEGISAPVPIKPYPLLEALKSAKGVKRAVVYLGQCYAGIFNYVAAGKGSANCADVIFIGATNLHSSISSATQEMLPKGNLHWIANVFLVHVFKWIQSPIDVDGDGEFTVMDSFKYASALANSGNIMTKARNSNLIFERREAWVDAEAAHANAPTNQTQMTLDAAGKQYMDTLEIIHVDQDGWILNAIPAQRMAF